MLSAENLCKLFGTTSGQTFCGACSGSKQFTTLKVFLKEFFENTDFEKKSAYNNEKHEKINQACKELIKYRMHCMYSRLCYIPKMNIKNLKETFSNTFGARNQIKLDISYES